MAKQGNHNGDIIFQNAGPGLSQVVQIRINEKIYLKDPESSELGRKIVAQGLLLIDEIGFEHFTFRKLASRIQSTEASVYRYFENKHKLLVYLVSWYWNWLEYQLTFHLHNIESLEERMRMAIRIVTHPHKLDQGFVDIDKAALHRLVINESAKAWLSKEVDAENKEGYFWAYKRLSKRIADLIRDLAPDYPYPTALVSTMIEAAHHQKFFSEHLPRLTEIRDGQDEEVYAFLEDLVFRGAGMK